MYIISLSSLSVSLSVSLSLSPSLSLFPIPTVFFLQDLFVKVLLKYLLVFVLTDAL